MNDRCWRRLSSRRTIVRTIGQTSLLLPMPSLAERLLSVSVPPRVEPASRVILTDITRQAGLGSARNISGAPEYKQFLLEEMGGGVALFDYDNDGWLDIFLVNCTKFDDIPESNTPHN